MNFKRRMRTIILSIALFPSLGSADSQFGEVSPTKFNGCPELKIKDVEGSSGYHMSKNCKIVYVLPPRIGSLRVNDYKNTGYLENVCSTISVIEKGNEDYAVTENLYNKRMRKNAEKISENLEYITSGLFPAGETEDDLDNKIFALEEKSSKMREKVLDFHRDYVTRMQYYSSREGASGTFLIENTYSELIEKFRDKNSGLDVSFARMPLRRSFLTIVDKSSNPEINKIEMRAVLDLKVPGLSRLPAMEPVGALLGEGQVESVKLQDSFDLFGDSLSGEIRLSTVGACGVSKGVGSVDNFSAQEVKAYIAPNVVFEYEVMVARKHSLTFRMSELFKKIQKQTKKGGLFSSKTINSLIDDRRTDSWLEFHSYSGDTSFEYTDAYIKEVKAEFLDRALRQVVAAKSGGAIAPLALIKPNSKNGSDVIGEELSKCPHIYCQIGAAGFKVLSAIFGSTEATAELTEQFEGESREIVESYKMVPRIGTMTFD